MKKIITLAILIASLNTNAQSHHHNQKDLGNRFTVGAGGVAFILMGALKTPEQRWVVDASSPNTNSYNQHGYWRTEKIYENPERSACVITGVILTTVSLTIKF